MTQRISLYGPRTYKADSASMIKLDIWVQKWSGMDLFGTHSSILDCLVIHEKLFTVAQQQVITFRTKGLDSRHIADSTKICGKYSAYNMGVPF